MAVGQEPITNESVQPPAGTAKPCARVATDRSWRAEGLAGHQPPGEIPIVDADIEARRAELSHLGRQLPVAAPGQRAEPDLACALPPPRHASTANQGLS